MSDLKRVSLRGVMETLMVPLYVRAIESIRSDGIIRDTYAIKILNDSGYKPDDFKIEWTVFIGIAARTWLFDRAVTRFLKNHPNGVIVNFGCGLDARCYRLDNGAAVWIDIDFDEVITLRRNFYQIDSRHIAISASVTSDEWIRYIPTNKPLLFVAEGLLMYLKREDVVKLLVILANKFQGANFIFETLSSERIAASRERFKKPRLGAPFQWGMDQLFEAESWAENIRVLASICIFDYFVHRWRWIRFWRFFPKFRRATRITQILFSEMVPKGQVPTDLLSD